MIMKVLTHFIKRKKNSNFLMVGPDAQKIFRFV